MARAIRRDIPVILPFFFFFAAAFFFAKTFFDFLIFLAGI
jgi:ABC-type dipeptide/oligopeptide/nickel transport system permease component